MLPVEVQANDYTFGNEKLPAISVSASRDKNGAVHVSLVNIDPNKAQEITVNLTGVNASGVTGRILTSGKVQDYNTFENPSKIQPAVFGGANLKNNVLTVKLPPVSVVVLALK